MKLKKDLSLLDIFCITSGAMMSSGLFLLPGMAYARAGAAVLLSYLFAALLAATGMLSQAELASAMPRSGGTYFYVTRTMGPAMGTIYGLITFLALALKASFELIAMAVLVKILVDLDVRLIAAGLCMAFILLNLAGTKEAGRVQTFMVLCILAALAVYVVMGGPAVNVPHFDPLAGRGVKAIVSTAGFVFVSYGGLLKIASIAEEVKDPGRTLPLGMILSLVVVVIVYMTVIFVTIGTLDPQSLAGSLTPVADAARTFMGKWSALLVIAAVLAFASAANAGIMGASRYPLALSRDDLVPRVFGEINLRFKTPHFAIIVTGACMVAAIFLRLETIVKAASCVLILTYVFSCLAVIIIRESHVQNYQPRFRSPLYPWIQIAGTIGFCFLLVEIGSEALIISAGLIAAGLFLYWFYGRIRAVREYALLHLIERITARELTTGSLECELKEIIHERDDIIKDRFDRIIENCEVLDVPGPVEMESFFEIVAEKMAPRLGQTPQDLVGLLRERERESSTVISPGLAIPHVIIPGEQAFDILMARSKEGIAFSDDAPAVHAVFVLMGAKDERNFHLRALAAIAQIVQDPNFEKKWMRAKNPEALRDIVLLGERRR